MAYTLVKAVALTRTIGSQWNEVDISTVSLMTVYSTYYKVFLELSHVSLTDNIYIDLDIFKQQYSNYIDTIGDLLVLIGDISLVTVDGLPNTTIKYVKYADAFRSFYKVNLANIGQNLPDDYPVELLDDAYLTRPKYDTDMSLIDSHALVTINGYIHSTIANSSRTYIKDAGKTLRKSRNNGIGILSFLDVSKLTKIHLESSMISGQPPDGKLYDRAYIDTNVSLGDRAYFMVIGGYIVFPGDNLLWKVSDDTIAVNMSILPLVERLYESDATIDLSHLEIQRDPFSPSVFNLSYIKSDVFMMKYLTANNTFIVVLDDVNHLSYNKIHLRHSNLPGMFTAYQQPVYPLIVNYGRMAEYWTTEEDTQWSVTVHDSFMRNYVIDFYTKPELELINNHLIPMTPNEHSRGYLLEIGGSVV